MSPSSVLRQFRVRPRLFIAGLAGWATALILPHCLVVSSITCLIISWNVGAIFYLALAGVMMVRSSNETLRRRAQLEDEGQLVILMLVIMAAITSLATLVIELGQIKAMTGAPKLAHIGLVGLTIVSSWAFTHTMFALHYAHDYYQARAHGKAGGLQFPGDEDPDYGDFMYFAFVIGTSGQTADVGLASHATRRIGLVHCVLAYAFNTTVLALTINIAASLL